MVKVQIPVTGFTSAQDHPAGNRHCLRLHGSISWKPRVPAPCAAVQRQAIRMSMPSCPITMKIMKNKVMKMRFTNINSPCRHLPGAIYAIYSARPPNSPQGKLSKVANSNQALTTLSWRVQLLGSSFRFRKRNSLFRLRVVQKVEAVTWFGCRHSLQCLRMSIHPRLSDTKCPLNIPGYGSPVRHLGWWTSRPAVAWNPGYENETTSSRCPNVLSVHVKTPLISCV